MTPLTGLFIGAGASCEVSMPLVWELTEEIRGWLTTDKFKQLNEGWRAQGGGYSEVVVEDFLVVLNMGNLHYESILGYLEAQSKRSRDYLQEYSGLYSWMVELVYRLLYFRHVNNEELIDKQLQQYEGICSFVNGESPLWVFSLNHDLIVESIAEKFSIPIYTGFGPGRVTLPRRNKNGEKIGVIEAEVLTEDELENGAMYFPNPPRRGIYLLKIHGALDVFTFNEGNDLLKFLPDTDPLVSVGKVLRYANEELVYIVPGYPGELVNATNEITYADDSGVMQFLRRSLLAGAYKFQEGRHQVLPKSMLKHFRSNLNAVTKLVCIGYGFGDLHINQVMRDWLGFSAGRSIEIVNPGLKDIPSFLLHLAPQVTLVDSGATDYFDSVAGIKRSRLEVLEKKVAAKLRNLGKVRGKNAFSLFFERDAAEIYSAYLEKIRSYLTPDGKLELEDGVDPVELGKAWMVELQGTEEARFERFLDYLNTL